MANIVYFGSPAFSAQILESLLENKNLRISAIATNPDKPTGRKQILTPTPVAQLAQKHHLPLFKPQKLDNKNLAHIKLLKPDLFLIVSYGKIIPQSWLGTPKINTLNLHFSLLPKYRGALCIQEAIKNQDRYTGVTLMEMDQQLDHGPIIAQVKQIIDTDDNTETLTNKLTLQGQALLNKYLPLYLAGKLKPKAQNHPQASYTPSYKSLNHKSAFIPYSQFKNPQTHFLINSLNPKPGAWTIVNNKKIKILKTKLAQNKLKIQWVQIPGKTPISWAAFQRGHAPSACI